MRIKEELKIEFDEKVVKYEVAQNNLVSALILILEEQGIPYLKVDGRVKDFDSFYSKVKDKNYTDPFIQNTDFCGLRVIVYYLHDLEKIKKIFNKEFKVKEFDSKTNVESKRKFGYRSDHYLINLHKYWCKTPNYKGLDNLTFEIQVRTVLMHAWAEIEHKLGYKSENSIPPSLRDSFSELSKILENVDDKFQEIYNKSKGYSEEILKKSELSGQFQFEEMNLDSFRMFLEFYYPNEKLNISAESDLYESIIKNNIESERLIEIADQFREKENQLDDLLYAKFNNPKIKSTRANKFTYALEVMNNTFSDGFYSTKRMEIVNKLKED